MEESIISLVTKKGIDTYFKERQYEALYWPAFFPLKPVSQLTFTTLIGEQGGRVAADIIAYDASAPLKTRQVLAKMTGDIPKTAVIRKMTETDMLEYSQLKAVSDPDEVRILDLVYGDLDFVVDSANGRLEWVALQIISTTSLTLSISNNKGRVTEEAVDFLMPAENKFAVSAADTIWSIANALTMTPITDFENVQEQANSEGKRVESAYMDTASFKYFTNSKQAQDFMKAYGGIKGADVLPFKSLDFVNSALTDAKLPAIVLIEQSIGIEADTGVITYSNPWNTNFVTFTPGGALGNMLSGPIAEELFPPKNVTQSKSSNILISKFSTVNPTAEFTKAETNSFPSWKNVNDCYSLRTSAITWAA